MVTPFGCLQHTDRHHACMQRRESGWCLEGVGYLKPPTHDTGKEVLRKRTDGLHLGFVDRREGSVVHCLQETGPDEGGR